MRAPGGEPALPAGPAAVLALQRSAGNAAVATLVSGQRGRVTAARLDRCAGDCTCDGTCGEQTRAQENATARPPSVSTSPPAGFSPHDLAEEPVELTVPLSGAGIQRGVWDWIKSKFAGKSVPCLCAEELTVKGTGAIEGSFGIGDYWPGVTPYWGADKTLGQFDEPWSGGSGWRMLGHKFQVIGRFSTQKSAKGGEAAFQQMARLTTTKGGTAGAWFDDMDYVDAGGGAHHWDPNAEAGTSVRTGYPGVRRTIATDKRAYTDPPAIAYSTGSNSYRKLEFEIFYRSPPGCPCTHKEHKLAATQEIEVVNGTPTVIKAP